MKSIGVKLAVATILLSAAALALAAPGGIPGPGSGGGGGGGGGNGHKPPTGETGGNNLSVPMMMINSGFMLSCGTGEWADMIEIDADDPAEFPKDCAMTNDGEVCVDAGFYYLQGVHKWQARCKNIAAADLPIDVYGAWGDNLAGDARFKVGSPIRVELVLEDASGEPQQFGYQVIKLEPNELDRASAYGTLATGSAGSYVATPTLFTPLVHNGKATFGVQHADNLEYAVPPGTNPTAEINATGKIVYGYNLRVGEPGDYYVTFTVPDVNFTACNHALDEDEVCTGDTTKIRITVTAGGGGGGGGGGKPR